MGLPLNCEIHLDARWCIEVVQDATNADNTRIPNPSELTDHCAFTLRYNGQQFCLESPPREDTSVDGGKPFIRHAVIITMVFCFVLIDRVPQEQFRSFQLFRCVSAIQQCLITEVYQVFGDTSTEAKELLALIGKNTFVQTRQFRFLNIFSVHYRQRCIPKTTKSILNR